MTNCTLETSYQISIIQGGSGHITSSKLQLTQDDYSNGLSQLAVKELNKTLYIQNCIYARLTGIIQVFQIHFV